MAGTAQHGIEGIPQTALEPVAAQLAFVLHVTDCWFNCASSMNGSSDRRGDTTLLATAPDRYPIDGYAAIAPVDKHCLGFLIGENAHLLDGFRQRMTIVGIAGQTAHADDQTLSVRRRHRTLTPNS